VQGVHFVAISEMIIDKVKALIYYCKNMHKDCPKQLTLKELVKHEATCEF